MNPEAGPTAAPAAQPKLPVRQEGELLTRTTEAAAKAAEREGLGRVVGKGRRRHFALNDTAQLTTRIGWRGRCNTRHVTADGSCRHHRPGEKIGGKFNLEFVK